MVAKLSEVGDGEAPNAIDLIKSGEVSFVVNTPRGGGSRSDGQAIRMAANTHRVSSVTTVEAALAAVHGLAEQKDTEVVVRSLQEYHGR